MSTLTISSQALGRLLGSFIRPSDDTPTPVGPWGPVIRSWDWLLLNPQPLPPRWRYVTTNGRRLGPQPGPWHMALVTRAVISKALDSFEQAAIIVVGGDQDRPTQAIGDGLRRYVDDLCPEPPRLPKPTPWPWPWGEEFDATLLDPVSLLAAGAQFERVASTIGEHPLQTVMADAATRLFETGVARLEPGAPKLRPDTIAELAATEEALAANAAETSERRGTSRGE